MLRSDARARSLRTSHRAARLADLLLFGAVLLAPLAVGSVHPIAWSGLFLLGWTAWLLALRAPGDRVRPRRLVLVPALALLGVVLLSLVPMPRPLLGWLSPQAADLWAMGPPAGSPDEGWRPLHQAPAAGRFALLKVCTLLVFAWAASLRAAVSGWREKAELAIVASGLTSIVVCAWQTVQRMPRILGVYEPRWGFHGELRPPMVNYNHWAAWMGLVLVVCIDQAVDRKSGAIRRALAILVGLGCAWQLVLSGSRIGLVGAAVGVVALTLVRGLTTQGSRRARRFVLAAAAVVVVGLVAVQVDRWTPDRLEHETGEFLPVVEAEAKLAHLPAVWSLIGEHPLAGVGKGAFGDVFTRYRTRPGRQISAHVESLPIQLVADHGLVLGGALVATLLLLLAACVRSALRNPPRAVAAAALLGLVAHDIGDFSLETGAVAAAAVLLAAIALPGKKIESGSRKYDQAALVATLVVFALTLPSLVQWDGHRDYLRQRRAQPDDWGEVTEVLWARHPSSFVVAQAVASSLAAEGQAGEAIAHLNRAMVLAPYHSEPDILAARLLARIGSREQALLQYRIAAGKLPPIRTRTLMGELVATFDDEELGRLLPDDSELLPWFALWLQERDHPAGPDVALRAAEHHPDSSLATVVQARALAATGHGPEALALLERQPAPGSPSAFLLAQRARAARRAGGVEEGLAELVRGQGSPEGDLAWIWLIRGSWEIEAGRLDEARTSLTTAERTGTRRIRATSLARRARLERLDGRPGRALALAARARDASPGLLEAELEEVRALVELGQRRAASSRLDSIRTAHPGEVPDDLVTAVRALSDGGARR